MTTMMLLTAFLGGSLLKDAAAAPLTRAHDGRGVCKAAVRVSLSAETRLETALSALVSDDTLTQDQADAILDQLFDPRFTAQTDETAPTSIADGDRRDCRGAVADRAWRCAASAQFAQATIDAVTVLLGLDASDIMARLAAGESLAQIADAEGVARTDLVTALHTGTILRLDAAEAAGAITPEERADREAASLIRIESLIDRDRADRPTSSSNATPATT